MNKKYFSIIGALLLLALGTGAYAIYKNSDNSSSETQTAQTVQADTSSDTYKQYAAMTGETYDRNFIANMIAHHQGAVDMAKAAQSNAKHSELKTMADNIVTAQEKEIADMLAWQKDWGYPSTSAEDMQDHSAMGMMDSMSGMMTELEGKTGDDFDKAFLEQMILHHQGAIDMAAPGKDNASRQEVKDLSSAIVNDQMKEIAQMRTWQNEWGYNN
jgi:uncharacterized protein (DUF305 family)